ncbi:MAG: hypothetical protein ACR2H0_07760 [Candidatus Limnocylindrales bacterium]
MGDVLPFSEASRHSAVVAGTAFLWGAFALTTVAIAARMTPGRRAYLRTSDLVWGFAIVLAVGAWIFSAYQWNIAKFGGIELDAVGPTTSLLPLITIVAAVLLVTVRGAGGAVKLVPLVIVATAFAVLVLDIALGAAGAIRDGSVSELGMVVGVLEVGLATFLAGGVISVAHRPKSGYRGKVERDL